MVSRIFFDIEVDGSPRGEFYVDLKQCVGSNFETGSIEVSSPQGYKGPFNYEAFRDGVEKYYRSLIGLRGKCVHIKGGDNIRMANNVYVKEVAIEFDVHDRYALW